MSMGYEENPHVLPIIQAILNHDNEMAKKLIVQKKRINNQNPFGFTALLMAIEYEEIELVSLLLENGADPNIFNNAGDSPLSFVAKQNLGISIVGTADNN